MAFSPDTKLLAGWCVLDLHVWDTATGEKKCSVRCDPDSRLGGFSPDGRWLLVQEDGTLALKESETGRTAHEAKEFAAAVGFASDGSVLGVRAATISRWIPQSGEFKTLVADFAETPLCLSPDGQYVVSVRPPVTVQDKPDDPASYAASLWSLKTGRRQSEFLGHADAVTCALFMPDGKTLLTGSRDGTVRFWSIP
ncbi:MAG: hypothetical protein PHO07_20900 [Pirellulales bacterium]|nr:hypothetical protein [Pirellulales bacterium]MDI9443145.1 hypothetical protein [Planctomycetota bacterium]